MELIAEESSLLLSMVDKKPRISENVTLGCTARLDPEIQLIISNLL